MKRNMRNKVLTGLLSVGMLSALMATAAFAKDRGTRTVEVGQSITLTAEGGYPYAWNVEDETIASAKLEGTYKGRCVLTGLRPGTMTVTVRSYELVYDPNARADWFGDYGENVSQLRTDTWQITVTGTGGTDTTPTTTTTRTNTTRNNTATINDNIESSFRYFSDSSESETSTGRSGGWKRNHVGWWYEYTNGSYPRNTWSNIDGAWYCFDGTGYMMTGWIWSGNQWYYCDPREGSGQGAMLTSTYTPDGYWVNSDGVWNS